MASKSAFTVATQNRFAQLDSDVDSESEVAQQQAQQLAAQQQAAQQPTRKPAFKKPTAAEEGTTAVSQPRRQPQQQQQQFQQDRQQRYPRQPLSPNDQRPVGAQGARSAFPRGGGAGGATNTRPLRFNNNANANARNIAEAPPAEGGAENYSGDDAGAAPGAGRPRGGGGFRGGSGAGGAFTTGARPRREYDRRSGTGRPRGEMKKHGAGGHNWGNAKTDVDVTMEAIGGVENVGAPGAVVGENASVEAGTPPAGDLEKPAFEKKPSEPQEEDMLNLQEYMRTMKQKRAQVQEQQSAIAPRMVDATDLERDGYTPYQKEETDYEKLLRERREREQADEDEDEDAALDGAHRGKTYNLFEFTGDMGPRRGGRGRGGGPGGRGGRGGNDRDNNRDRQQPQQPLEKRVPQHQPVQVDLRDACAFPALG